MEHQYWQHPVDAVDTLSPKQGLNESNTLKLKDKIWVKTNSRGIFSKAQIIHVNPILYCFVESTVFGRECLEDTARNLSESSEWYRRVD